LVAVACFLPGSG